MFLCLPGAARSGGFSVRGSFLVPHPADAWAELCISGVAYLNHRLLFLEDYEGGGWEQRTRDLELEWRGGGLNSGTVVQDWREAPWG